jgi:hypothetical protein
MRTPPFTRTLTMTTMTKFRPALILTVSTVKEYVQTHEAHDNSMAPRTVGALALQPAGNAQVSFYFFSLKVGFSSLGHMRRKLPIPADVVVQVHALARRQREQLGLLVGDRLQRPAPFTPVLADHDEEDDDDEDDDDSSTYLDEDPDDDDDISASFDQDGQHGQNPRSGSRKRRPSRQRN